MEPNPGLRPLIMTSTERADELEKARPTLMGLAFRLLGSREEAEDAVQDTAYKWLFDEGPFPREPRAWLTKVCTNRCIDILRSPRRSRTDYVGPWLPDVFETGEVDNVEARAEIASSLSVAFLLLLERLTPRERAAYLLHEVFDFKHVEVSKMLEISTENSRKLTSRAKQMVAKEGVRFIPGEERQTQLLSLFKTALETGDIEAFASALSEDVELHADSGGRVPAIREVLNGHDAVHTFLRKAANVYWSDAAFELRKANGALALLVLEKGKPHALVSIAIEPDFAVAKIFIQRHPDKLAAYLRQAAQPDPGGGLLLE